MTPIKRYDPVAYFEQGGCGYGDTKQVDDGDFVRYEDYESHVAKLEKQLETAKTYISTLASGTLSPYYQVAQNVLNEINSQETQEDET
jgi:hypothetical protein